MELFQYPTVSPLAEHMRGVAGDIFGRDFGASEAATAKDPGDGGGGHWEGWADFPEHGTLREFWRNLEGRGGVDFIF